MSTSDSGEGREAASLNSPSHPGLPAFLGAPSAYPLQACPFPRSHLLIQLLHTPKVWAPSLKRKVSRPQSLQSALLSL